MQNEKRACCYLRSDARSNLTSFKIGEKGSKPRKLRTGAEKRIYYHIPKKRISWSPSGHDFRSTANINVDEKKLILCILMGSIGDV